MSRLLTKVVGFDDAPFVHAHRGDVLVVGAVYASRRLEGVLSGRVRRDGADATRELVRMVSGSRFGAQLQAVFLQGIALAGFNVVDVRGLHDALGIPVVVVARRQPDLEAVRDALLARVRGGRRKWRLVEALGPMEPVDGVFVQRVGIERPQAVALVRHFAVNGALPEPIRTAHLIAGGVTQGQSRHRA